MKKIIPLIVFLVIGAFLFLSLNSNPNKLPSPLIGKKFPILEGVDFYKNEKVKLNDLMANQLTLVNVWASWCVTCKKEHQMIMDIAQKNNLKLIGINYKDNKNDGEEYLKVMGNPFDEIIFDPKGKIGMELGVYATPESFLISKEGLIIYKHIGEITNEVWSENFEPHFNMNES
ncbi:MAG: DsbE family thiol:disulfide interchange protein [Pseudomonadota bacterium]|nr:DsbE family thiol:disulfide interchange protein [Pseudomonadota bacterium]